ncbi:hypothetical protein Trydic_g17944 [Trypoxylus dichotomus]
MSRLCTALKILTNILRMRITTYVGEYQAEKTWKFNVGIYQIFIAFKQAYDKVYRSLIQCNERDRDTDKVNQPGETTMNNSYAIVKIQHMLSEIFNAEQGLRQGDGLSPLLCNIALHNVIREMEVDGNSTIITGEAQVIAYEDDINIVGRTAIIKENMRN